MIKAITLLVTILAISMTVFLNPMNTDTRAQPTNQTNLTNAQQPDLSSPEQIQTTQSQIELTEHQI